MAGIDAGRLRDSARWGVVGLAAAALVAGGVAIAHGAFSGTLGKLAPYAVLAGTVALPPTIYLARHAREANPVVAFQWLLAAASLAAVASYLYGVSFYVAYPADFLMWSETDFVNDILKFRVGYPIFSAEANNESYTYPPGSQLLTYGLASLTGHPTSLPVMRTIQLLYTFIAVVVAMHATKRLLQLGSDARTPNPGVKITPPVEIALFAMLFLFATNALTNPFIHNLHNDALAQLVSAVGYALLVEYAYARDRRVLIAMLFVPAIGFLVKQNLAFWGAYFVLYLFVLDRPRSLKTAATFAAVAFALLCVAIGACSLVWGEDFTYWVFYVLSKHESVPARSVQHLIDVRAYLILGFAGAVALCRGPHAFQRFGLWSIWLLIMLLAVYTGGINFMRHHMGPASLIAGIWFMAGVLLTWPRSDASVARGPARERWGRGILVAVIAALLAGSGLGILRSPKVPLNPDAYRYLEAIEHEFEGQDARNILLDLGSFVYLEDGIVMKDRASPIGERGSTDTGDLSGVIGRFDAQRYDKLLLRNFGTDNFWYDHPSWPKASGIRALLEARYREVGRIPAVAEPQSLWSRTPPYGFAEITILVPRASD